jgi:hypothetical protein
LQTIEAQQILNLLLESVDAGLEDTDDFALPFT